MDYINKLVFGLDESASNVVQPSKVLEVQREVQSSKSNLSEADMRKLIKTKNVKLDKLTKQVQFYKEEEEELQAEVNKQQDEMNDNEIKVEEHFKQLGLQFSKLIIIQNKDKQISNRTKCFHSNHEKSLTDAELSSIRAQANEIKDIIIKSHIPEDPFNLTSMMTNFQAEINENEKLIAYYNKINKQLLEKTKSLSAKTCKDCDELLIPANDTCSKHLGEIKCYSESEDDIIAFKDKCENCDGDIYYSCCLKCSKCYPECRTYPHRF